VARGTGVSEAFVKSLHIEHPIICGAMYPCSNPELVAAASEAGGIGIVQPLSLIYVFKYDLRAGLQEIRKRTQKPIGFNVLTEASSERYLERMRQWVDIALEEGVRFFITALGNPRWIVERVKPLGGVVYHDVTERKWAEKALAAGVDGLICVNNRAGGHAGTKSPEELLNELRPLGVPLVCAGGVGDRATYQAMLRLGYDAVQMGTRFIASEECSAHSDYKAAILKAEEKDIVLTKKLTGVPVSIINTPSVEKMGTEVGPLARFMLSHSRLKHYMRLYYSVVSFWKLKQSNLKGLSYKDFWQAGKSVGGIERVQKVSEIISELTKS
jgi:nitronate monooxygenase